MDLGLRGKVALVTAASKGMGKACALEFAREGAKVAMCARTESDLKTAADEVRAATKADVLAIPADVTKKDDVQALTQRVSSQWGGVDILVANAGGPARGFFEEMSDEQWQQAFELSLLSVVRLVRAVLPGMQARKWGRVLTIQSVSVKQPLPDLLLSNAVRPGTNGLIKTLAGRFGKDNITFNTVCPGRIMTDRLMGGLKASGLSREAYLAQSSADIPLGRVGCPASRACSSCSSSPRRSSAPCASSCTACSACAPTGTICGTCCSTPCWSSCSRCCCSWRPWSPRSSSGSRSTSWRRSACHGPGSTGRRWPSAFRCPPGCSTSATATCRAAGRTRAPRSPAPS